ncbi:nickel pincer cofactor biosynthesis protein LarC [Chamaesiphon minutus]|uniref:Putative nickel insertion protein n=1 Tax=Chamaesiphon minutus (strain ATCC 27169 / PCC 6605) TaxID=1173020 RepID=K9UAL4_CHAP6|nr:nickel pincer cofactor biosynthesis protein LarC [Chamaesiphon minutus]AFY91865.1 TIGR00299 family protein [Chamaesiphon minutus PCC 6605]
MIKIAYLECQTGIAGDMCLGALVDAGVPIEYLNTQLARLGIASEYHLWANKVHHNGQIATKVHVDLTAMASAVPSSAAHRGHSHPPHEHHHPHPAPAHIDDAAPRESHEHPHHHPHEHPHPHPAPLGHHPHPHEHAHSHPTQPASGTRNFQPQHYTHIVAAEPIENDEHHHHHHYDTPQRNLPQIEKLIVAANLPARATQWSLDIFRQLAIAEGAVHGIEPSEVHFHEVGAVDAIVDIVGTCLGLDYLDVAKIYCSPLPIGGGTVRAAHGILPVPVPAVLKLFSARNVPVYSNKIDRELVTPTGAAIAVTLATEFGAPLAMQLHQIGLGAGTIELPIPNILRIWLGTEATSTAATTTAVRPEYLETIEVLSTQIDDLNPQAIGYIFDRLFQAGAVDVFTQPIGMKKSRSGILLTVICPLDKAQDCERIIFTETSTLGIRRDRQTRSILPREIQSVVTKYGKVRIKVARNNLVSDDSIVNVQPEYDDCASIAQAHQIAWREVHQLALMAWHDLNVQ